MEYLRKLFKYKEKPFSVQLMVMAVLGIVLLVVSGLFLKEDEKLLSENSVIERENNGVPSEKTYEMELEGRLGTLLSKVEGAGLVEVMISISYGTEIVLAENVSSNETWVQESDSAGGSRENRTKVTENNKIIMQGAGGVQQPLAVKEIVPKVEGVIIVAQGGGDILVKEALMNAAKTVLGIEMHKVQVLKMKE